MDPPSKAFFCNNATTTSEFSEESGWTMYFDEDLSTGYEVSHSPASEGASSVKKKVNEKGGVSGLKTEKSCRKLSLKKWKKGFEEEDALEDTATSPYSSSKVMKQQKATQLRDRNREEAGLIARDSELRKNGLCLVPLSFAFSYFG